MLQAVALEYEVVTLLRKEKIDDKVIQTLKFYQNHVFHKDVKAAYASPTSSLVWDFIFSFRPAKLHRKPHGSVTSHIS